MVSRLSWGLWQYVECFFSYIPKVVYLLYTALASCLDALQCLMRRLAGLDVYYVNTNSGAILGAGGTPVYQQDPVLEFIMGILGIGENAAAYSALTTTFWSLTIFGAIVLVISTMVAIIKSHYNEDSGKTNPITYIYTAIKSVFTFAIVPVVVIAGFWLSSFMLRTLDNITAGYATEETLEGIYGTKYNEVFAPMTYAEGTSSEKQIYTRYDFFSAGAPSTTQTFSGVLFKAAANDANRIRRGEFDYSKGTTNAGVTKNSYYNFNLIGTADSMPSTLTTDEEKTEWAAYQLDYAFANNLWLKNLTHVEAMYAATNAFITITDVDVFALVGFVKSMSKYNVGLVWYYYNLWSFNFMVGFAGVVACFLLFASIIIGLMTRIIKSAALFLIYPAILGLAPLDEFGGFKKWRTEFMQQVLMAFGSIIGMNVFFLIFPYLGNISFFNVGILDYMVNIVIIITGLMMVKGFIGFLSGLVGGADAAAVGGDMGKQVAGAALKAGGMMLGAGNIALKAGKYLSPTGRIMNASSKAIRMNRARRKADDYDAQATREQADVEALETTGQINVDNARTAQDTLRTSRLAARPSIAADVETELDDEGKARGYTGDALDRWKEKNRADYQHRALYANDATYKSDYDTLQNSIDNGGLNADQKAELERHKTKRQEAIDNAKATRTSNYMDEDGNEVPHMLRQMEANDAKALGGAIAKGIKDGMKDLNLNFGGLIGTLARATNNELDDKGKISKVWGEPREAATTQRELDTRREERGVARGRFADSLAGVLWGYGNAGKKDDAPKTGDKLGQASLKEDEKQTKGIEDLGRKIDKLTDAILKGK